TPIIAYRSILSLADRQATHHVLGSALALTASERQRTSQKRDSRPSRDRPRELGFREPDHARSLPMKFRPLHDRVVVRRVEEDTKTKGGIIIPDTAQEKPMQGEIIAVGPGGRDENGKLIPIDVKAGDVVLFGKWSGTEVKLDGVEYLIMKESDIMGVIEGKSVKKAAA